MFSRFNALLAAITAPASDGGRPTHTLQLATAVLLIEVMRSDAECTAGEQAAIISILRERFNLTDAEVTQLSRAGLEAAVSANDFQQFTAVINQHLSPAEKVRIVEYMWQVAYADGKITADENHLLRKIAALLFVPHADYITAKLRAKAAGLT
jgi:uncharacterized tellurite resistance protein B-like protein